MKDKFTLKEKLSQKPPSQLRERVFSKIETNNTKPWFLYTSIGAALSVVLIVLTINFNNSTPQFEEGVAEVLEYQVLIENQELFAEIDAIDLEDEDWDYLLEGQI